MLAFSFLSQINESYSHINSLCPCIGMALLRTWCSHLSPHFSETYCPLHRAWVITDTYELKLITSLHHLQIFHKGKLQIHWKCCTDPGEEGNCMGVWPTDGAQKMFTTILCICNRTKNQAESTDLYVGKHWMSVSSRYPAIPCDSAWRSLSLNFPNTNIPSVT